MDELGARRTTTGKEAHRPDEVPKLLAACDRLEQKALIALAACVGIRRGDSVAVERDAFNWIERDGQRAARVRYWVEKKDRPWESWVLPEFASPIRMQWKAVEGERWLFPSSQSTSGHISSKTAYNWYQEALETAGMRSRPFHALRATAIKLCQHRGWSVEQTMEQVDATWETIQKHYMTPSDAEMEEAVFDPDGKDVRRESEHGGA